MRKGNISAARIPRIRRSKSLATSGLACNRVAGYGVETLEQRMLLSANLFVASVGFNAPNGGSIGEYTTDGAVVNASLFPGLNGPAGLAQSGSDLFVALGQGFGGPIAEYNFMSGTTVNATLVPSTMANSIAISGSDIFAANHDSSNGVAVVSEYTTSGATVNASLISESGNATGIAVSGSDVFVANIQNGTIGEFTTSGATVNASLITGVGHPSGIAVSGSDLFVVDQTPTQNSTGAIREYTTSGVAVNTSLVTFGLFTYPVGLAVSGSDLFITNFGPSDGTSNDGFVSEYTTSGTLANASVAIGLTEPVAIAIESSGQTVGPATQLAIAAQPNTATAGSALSPAISVDVEDANGNLVTTDTSNVTVSIAPGSTAGGTLGGTTTVAAQGGVATFNNLTLSPSGSYTLTASDNGLTSAATTAITVSAGSSSGGLVNNSPLTPTIVAGRLPTAALVAGNKVTPFSQSIRITNNSSSTINGNAAVSLLLSTDPTGASGGTAAASVTHKLVNLKPGKFVTVPVTIRTLPQGVTGALYILPQITDPSANTSFTSSTGTISVAAPFIDLQPLLVHSPASVKAGKKGIVTVTLINNGNVTASDPLAIDVQAALDQAIDSTSTDLGTTNRPQVRILPHAKLVVVLTETFPNTGGPFFVVANVDPANTFNESTLANNVLASVTTVKLT